MLVLVVSLVYLERGCYPLDFWTSRAWVLFVLVPVLERMRKKGKTSGFSKYYIQLKIAPLATLDSRQVYKIQVLKSQFVNTIHNLCVLGCLVQIE